MKKYLLIAALLVVMTLALPAQDSGFGIGFRLGSPTGLSLKLWLDDNSALDATLAWAFRGDGRITVHVDYLYHFFDVFDIETGQLPLYIGAGAMAAFNGGGVTFGLRAPIGLAYLFEDVSLDVFGELAPGLMLFPDMTFDLDAAAGLRYFF